MDFGVNVATSADSWKVAARAEALGFSHAWFFDTQMINADMFVAMAAAAMRTERIKLCAGVLIPSNRIAPVAANALASLAKLAPGRVECGIGTGFTARRAMGLAPVKLADLEAYVEAVRGLLAGRTVSADIEGGPRKIRFLNPELGLIETARDIPVHMSALGPKGRAMTARLGLGWIVPARADAQTLAWIEDMRRRWSRAGRAEGDLYATVQCGGCILAEGEPADGARAMAQAGPAAAMVMHDMVEAGSLGRLGFAVPGALRQALEAFREIHARYAPEDARYLATHAGHLMVVRPEERPLIDAGMIRALSFTGTAAELRERVRGFRDAGFRQFSAHIRHGHPEMVEEWADLLATV